MWESGGNFWKGCVCGVVKGVTFMCRRRCQAGVVAGGRLRHPVHPFAPSRHTTDRSSLRPTSRPARLWIPAHPGALAVTCGQGVGRDKGEGSECGLMRSNAISSSATSRLLLPNGLRGLLRTIANMSSVKEW